MTGPLRIGVLGAASIAPAALLRPARHVPGVSVESVAARDPHRAQTFARQHALPRFHPTYDALLDDSGIDAVYIAVPNSLHLPWTLRALSAGKHVLCEKPLACNADEAIQVAEAAERSGRVAAEAMAYRHHPLVVRLVELTAQLGRLQHIEVFNCVPVFRRNDIRYQYDLGGGAAMDLGGYAISLVRLLTGAEPEVTGVEVRLAEPRVDRWTAADLRLPNGATAKITCSLWSSDFLRSEAKIRGESGRMKVVNPFAPHLFHYVTSQIVGSRRIRERVRHGGSTYACQLRAFVRAVREGGPMLTSATDAAQTLHVIDQMYRLAGLPIRHSMAIVTP